MSTNNNQSPSNFHDFNVVTLTKPTWCQLDNDLIYGIVRQGAKCRYCGMVVHRRCVNSLLSNNCDANLGHPASVERSPTNEATNAVNCGETLAKRQVLPRAVHLGLSLKNKVCTVIREGWLTYHTDSDRLRLPMDSIIAVEENDKDTYTATQDVAKHSDTLFEKPPVSCIGGQYPYVFVIRTPRIVIYAGQDPSFFERTSDWNELNQGIGRAYGLGWMNTIRQLCFALPVVDDVDIRTLFDLNPDDPNSIIGFGQFGIVYAAKQKPPRGTGNVAIKAIDKKHLEKLIKLSLNEFISCEIRTMKEISHPGIVRLIDCINSVEKIYIVMEKAHMDMLDFIINHQNSRLSERTTKFFSKQILVALKYLHTAHKMAHCDLKPENILLFFQGQSDEAYEFPVAKLADFGYTRIISDRSFRTSFVGTPAYLAPEVLTKFPLFNKELDSWSAGVVIFVSLSGVFPYNSDDEEAVLQLQKTPVVFPDDPWKKLSLEASRFVKSLLEVNIRQRASPAKALKHAWFTRDYQAWCDIRNLDARLATIGPPNSSFLSWTSADEEKQWEAYRFANGLPSWQQCGCKL